MDPAEYERMYDLEDTYWWFQGRRSIVASLLAMVPAYRRGGARVLDLGCGTGLMLEYLNRSCWPVGLDFSPLALEFTRRRGVGDLVRADVEHLPIGSERFDLVTALDLCEHVENDRAVLAEALRVLRPGGHAVITVPAHPYLWSDHDEALYHERRYRRGELRDRIAQAGFDLERLSYCITFTFPLIAGFRLLQRLLPRRADRPKTHLIVLPRWANWLLMASVRVEALALRRVDLPFGVTLVALARKPDGPREKR